MQSIEEVCYNVIVAATNSLKLKLFQGTVADNITGALWLTLLLEYWHHYRCILAGTSPLLWLVSSEMWVTFFKGQVAVTIIGAPWLFHRCQPQRTLLRVILFPNHPILMREDKRICYLCCSQSAVTIVRFTPYLSYRGDHHTCDRPHYCQVKHRKQPTYCICRCSTVVSWRLIRL